MSQVDQIRTLFQYHFDTIAALMDQAEQLKDADYYNDLGIQWGSVHERLLHVLATDQAYRGALETGQRPPPLLSEDYPDLESIQDLLEEERSAMGRYLNQLDDSMLEGEVTLSSGPDFQLTLPRWRYLHHLLFHGMQHQADIAARLTHFGHSPGDIDFIFYRGQTGK